MSEGTSTKHSQAEAMRFISLFKKLGFSIDGKYDSVTKLDSEKMGMYIQDCIEALQYAQSEQSNILSSGGVDSQRESEEKNNETKTECDDKKGDNDANSGAVSWRVEVLPEDTESSETKADEPLKIVSDQPEVEYWKDNAVVNSKTNLVDSSSSDLVDPEEKKPKRSADDVTTDSDLQENSAKRVKPVPTTAITTAKKAPTNLLRFSQSDKFERRMQALGLPSKFNQNPKSETAISTEGKTDTKETDGTEATDEGSVKKTTTLKVNDTKVTPVGDSKIIPKSSTTGAPSILLKKPTHSTAFSGPINRSPAFNSNFRGPHNNFLGRNGPGFHNNNFNNNFNHNNNNYNNFNDGPNDNNFDNNFNNNGNNFNNQMNNNFNNNNNQNNNQAQFHPPIQRQGPYTSPKEFGLKAAAAVAAVSGSGTGTRSAKSGEIGSSNLPVGSTTSTKSGVKKANDLFIGPEIKPSGKTVNSNINNGVQGQGQFRYSYTGSQNNLSTASNQFNNNNTNNMGNNNNMNNNNYNDNNNMNNNNYNNNNYNNQNQNNNHQGQNQAYQGQGSSKSMAGPNQQQQYQNYYPNDQSYSNQSQGQNNQNGQSNMNSNMNMNMNNQQAIPQNTLNSQGQVQSQQAQQAAQTAALQAQYQAYQTQMQYQQPVSGSYAIQGGADAGTGTSNTAQTGTTKGVVSTGAQGVANYATQGGVVGSTAQAAYNYAAQGVAGYGVVGGYAVPNGYGVQGTGVTGAANSAAQGTSGYGVVGGYAVPNGYGVQSAVGTGVSNSAALGTSSYSYGSTGVGGNGVASSASNSVPSVANYAVASMANYGVQNGYGVVGGYAVPAGYNYGVQGVTSSNTQGLANYALQSGYAIQNGYGAQSGVTGTGVVASSASTTQGAAAKFAR